MILVYIYVGMSAAAAVGIVWAVIELRKQSRKA